MSREDGDDTRYHDGFRFRPLGSSGPGGVLEFQSSDLDTILAIFTVMGNPGDEYAGEEKTWIPRDGCEVMAGMKNA